MFSCLLLRKAMALQLSKLSTRCWAQAGSMVPASMTKVIIFLIKIVFRSTLFDFDIKVMHISAMKICFHIAVCG